MSKPSDFFTYSGGQLQSGGISLSRIADAVGTPAYVYSADALLSPLKALKKGLAGIDHMVCFAMKSNSNLAVLKLLSGEGAGMDLVSGGELFRALRAGVPNSRIVFSGVGKTRDEIREALSKEIFSFNVESVAELKAIDEVARSMHRRAPVALRFNPDVDAKTHPYISTGLKKNKFGLQRPEILDIARKAADLHGVAIRGLSIHIGSQLLDLSPLSDSFARTKALAAEVDELLLAASEEPLAFLDLGGGVGITYDREKSPAIEKYCALIQKYFGPKSKIAGRYKILLEPGRLISGNAGVLLSRVLYRKERKTKDFLIVDAAMNDLLRPALYGSHHSIVSVKERKRAPKSKLRLTDVVGPVCESSDCFISDLMLSPEIAQGDLVAIQSAGAYGFTMASNYNSRPRPVEVLLERGDFRVIRERETLEDLIRGEIL